MFLKPDEHMILMITNAAAGASGLPWRDLTTDEIKRIRDECGITVAHEYLYWNLIEKQYGVYDWSLADKQVARCRDAGMRLILCTPINAPHCLPEHMYGRFHNTILMRDILSFWNMEAREYQRGFIKKAIERYGGDDVTVIYVGYLGEHYLWNTPIFFDDAAAGDFQAKYGVPIRKHAKGNGTEQLYEWIAKGVVDHCLAMQDAVVGQHNEVWDSVQHTIGLQSKHNGVFARPQVLAAYKERWPDATRWMLQYTYWGHGPGNAAIVDDLLEEHDCMMVVEADYCRGLASDPGTTWYAVRGGIHQKNPERWHAQVVCPLHPFGGNETQLEQWMLDAMKRAVGVWAEARHKPKKPKKEVEEE